MHKLRKTFVNLGAQIADKKMEFRKKLERSRKVKTFSSTFLYAGIMLLVFSGMGFVSYKAFKGEPKAAPTVYAVLEDQAEVARVSAYIEKIMKDYVSEGKKFSREKISGIPPQMAEIWNGLFKNIENPERIAVLNVKSSISLKGILRVECVAGEKDRFVFTLSQKSKKLSITGIDRLKS